MPLIPVRRHITPTTVASLRATVEGAGASTTSSWIVLLVILMLQEALRGSPFLPLPVARGGERELATMKPTAYLINTARGPIVDEPALVRVLQDRRIAGAALDVFEVEPLPDGSPLRTLDNVLLAPHNANSSAEAWKRVHENTIRLLLEGLRKDVR